MPREFLAVDVRCVGCAVAIEFHAVRCDVFFVCGEEFGVPWGMGDEEGGEAAEEDSYGAFDEEDEWPRSC
jgi:hypothetical protein